MALYAKKPVIIEAVVWDGKDYTEVIRLLQKTPVDYRFPEVNVLEIHTLEGWMTASIGDYIIRGVKGECYPCKPDIFEMTYEKVTN